MKVEDVMVHDPQCCRPDDDLATVANVMWDLDCGCVPIVGDARHIVGMITDRDACMAALLNGKPLHELRASAVMAREVVTAKLGERVHDVMDKMRKAKVRRVPVTDQDGKVVGIVSMHDVARAAMREKRRFFPAIRLKDVALTFAEVSHSFVKPAPPALAKVNEAYAE
jgi:CBS domain-containing protein